MGSSILNKKEVSAAQIGPRTTKDPRSRAYAIQTVHSLIRLVKDKEIDEQRIREELDRIAQYRHWEVLGYPSENALLEAEVGLTKKAIITKTRQRQQEAAAANAGEKVQKRGRPKKEIANLAIFQDARAAAKGISPAQQRKLDKLQSVAPSLHAKVAAGELTCHRACIAAKIVKPPTPLDTLRKAWAKASAKERREFLKWLKTEEL